MTPGLPRGVRAAIVLSTAAALSGCAILPGKVTGIIKAPDAVPAVVMTTYGPVRGASSARGQAFLGIPFAAPPLGPLRFAPPAAPTPWHTVRDATRIGAACPQLIIPGPESEDCLNLNIYAPPGTRADSRLPVMVWLYGGALELGSNAQYDPSTLAARQQVIVVAPNYRVGVFGFFAHPSLRGTGEGNYGLLDQQAALRWIIANVAAFGGDPQRITLFGESAGATSVCAQMALPGSQGLFQGAIMQSYTCIFPDAVTSRDEAEQAGLRFASKLGCADPATALVCLRALSARKLGRAKSQRRGNGGANGWSPMSGGDVLPRSPREIFESGDGARIPVLIGSNHDEGRLFSNALAFLFIMASRRGYEKSVRNALPEGDARAALAEYAEVARGSYARAFSAILTDSHFSCPVLSLHRLLGRSVPVYAYEFDDPHAPSKLPHAPCSPPLGSYHTSELAYVFQRPWALQNPKSFSASQWSLARRIQDHWGTFARTGSPAAGAPPTWSVFDGSAVHRLAPDEPSGTADDFAVRHHCGFWNARGY